MRIKNRKLVLTALFMLPLIFLSGCSTLDDVLDRVTDNVVDGVANEVVGGGTQNTTNP